MQQIFKLLLLLCGSILCSSCATQAYNEAVRRSHQFDYKNEVSSPQKICISPAHPYADVGPASGLPPLSQVPAAIGKPLPIIKDRNYL